MNLHTVHTFVSPLLLYLCLAIVCDASLNETRTDLLHSLRATSMTQLNEQARIFAAIAKRDDKYVEFLLASSVWGKEFLPAFVDTMEQEFDTEASSHMSANEINGWVYQQTKDKIELILPSLRPDESLVW